MQRSLSVALAAIVATLLAAELVLRILPVSTATLTGYHFDEDILSYPAHHEWTVSTGWDLRNPQRLRSNNWGFPSIEFVPDGMAVALIGDSYVEASMLAERDRPAAQLQRMLGGSIPVYGLGSPGTALLDFAQRIRFAHERFGVRDFVVWADAGDVRQAVCGSGNVHSRCLDSVSLAPRIERLPAPSLAKSVVRHSALAQYFFSQLKLDPQAVSTALLRRTVPVEGPDASRSTRVEVDPEIVLARQQKVRQLTDVVVAEFFRVAGPHLEGRLIVLVDGSRAAETEPATEMAFERAYLLERMRAGGAEVVDAATAYARHASRSSLSLEVGPYDRHLNSVGVGLAMGQAAAQLLQRPQHP